MKTIRPHFRFLLIQVILSSGCSDTGTIQHSFEHFLDNGVQIAENSGGPKFKEDLFKYESYLTLQQDPTDAKTLLYDGTQFEWDEKGFFMDEDGFIYVRDRGNSRIAVFDPTGNYERDIGREGQGPGEWSGSFELYEVSNGVLTVYDPGPRRTTYYNTDGTLLEMIHAPVNGFVIHYLKEEELFLVIGGSTEMGEDFINSDIGFDTVDKTGNTINSARSAMIRERYGYPWETRTGMAWAPMPYTVKPFARVTPDYGVAIIAGYDPIIWWYQKDGTLSKVIAVDLPRLRVTIADVEEYFQDQENTLSLSDNPREREQFRRIQRYVQVPGHKSFWSFITFDDQDYIWLEILELESERKEKGGILYHVLSPEGEYLGNTRAPAAGRADNGYFLGRVKDPESDKVDYRVWKLNSAIEGFVYP